MADLEAVMGEGGLPNPDAVKAYLRELRIGQHFSYAQFARIIGMSRRALIGWESGETSEIKQGPLIRALNALNASLGHLAELTTPDADAELGRRLARERLAEIAASMSDEELKKTLITVRRRRGRDVSDVLDGG